MKNKFLTLFLALAASVAPLFAQSGTCGDNLTWTLSNGTLTISGTGAMTSYGTYLDVPWYSYNSSISTVIIEEGVTSIGSYAFFGCSNLNSISISNSVTSVGYIAFSGCSNLPVIDNLRYADTYLVEAVDKTLSTYTIKEGTKKIGDYAFSDCSNLTSITIPNSVTSIGYSAFYGCSSLTSVTIGNSVTFIGNKAFSDCSKLKTVTIYAEIPPIAETYELHSQLSYFRVISSAFDGLNPSQITLFVPTPSLYGMDIYLRRFNIQGIDATDLKYTVTWKNYDGSVLETDENVAAGTIPAYNGATPVKPADDHYIYTFAGWSPTVVTVTGDATYVATYTATVKEHTYIIHVNQDCTSYMEEQQ